MSLINDMLKDLDAHRAHRNTAHDTALHGLGLAGDINTATRKSLAIVIGASMLVLLGVFAWPYATDILAHSGKTNATVITARDILKQLSTEHPAAQKTSARPLIARTSRAAATQSNYSTIKESKPEKTRSGAVEYRKTGKQGTQVHPSSSNTNVIVTHPLSMQERVQRIHQQAVQALRTGNHTRAENLLDQALALESNHHESRLLLANLYLRQQRNIDAESLLASGLAQNPGHSPFARLYAQLLVAQTRYTEAIQRLETALHDAERDAEYHALLAGLYQRTGKAPEAALQYQVALQLTPAKGEWWMGLGISQEQANNPEKAFDAYQRALQYPLDTPLQQFVKTQLKNLPR